MSENKTKKKKRYLQENRLNGRLIQLGQQEKEKVAHRGLEIAIAVKQIFQIGSAGVGGVKVNVQKRKYTYTQTFKNTFILLRYNL